MAAAFPFTSQPSTETTGGISDSTSFTNSTTSPVIITNGGVETPSSCSWGRVSSSDFGQINFDTIANMVNASNISSSSAAATSMACDKCLSFVDSLSELHALPCLHTLCRKCFRTQGLHMNQFNNVPTSHHQQSSYCPICGNGNSSSQLDIMNQSGGGSGIGTATSASLFQNFPIYSSFTSNFHGTSPAGELYNNTGTGSSRNAPILSSSYLFNEQLNVDTSLLIGSLLDSVSIQDDAHQLLAKGMQPPRRPSMTSSATSGKFPIPPVVTSATANLPPAAFRMFGNSNTPTAGTLSPSPFNQTPPTRPVQQPQQPFFSLAVGGHRSAAPGGGQFLQQHAGQLVQQPIPKLMSTSSSTSSFSNIPACSICTDGSEAVCRCDDCLEYLCVKCFQAHLRVRLTKDHRMVSLYPQQQNQSTNPSPASSSAVPSIPGLWNTSSNSSPATILQSRAGTGSSGQQQASVLAKPQQPSPVSGAQKIGSRQATTNCPQHQSEPMTFYCETCAEPLCRWCTTNNLKHPFPDHRITSMASRNIQTASGGDKANTQTEATPLNQLFNDSRQCVRVLDEAVRGVDHMTERVETRMHSVANEIRAIIHHHIGALEERKRELLERVDAVRTAKLGSLNSQKEELRKYLTSSKTSLEQAEDLLKSHQQKSQRQEEDMETVARIRNVLQEQLQVLKSSRPCLQPREDDQLSFSTPDAGILKTVRLLGNIITGAYAPNCTLLGDPVRRAIKDKPIYYTVQARDHVGEQLANGGDQVNAFVVATPTGNEAAAEPVPIPVDVVDKKNGTYVCRYEPNQEGEHQVHIFVRGCPIRGSPFTLIVRSGRDYTAIGPTPILSFGGEGTGDGQLCRPWGICCDKLGRIIVADRSNSRIQIFDQEGKFLGKFGAPGSRNGQFDRPAGVTVNSKNQIIVVDKDNHRVQVFSPDGQFLFKFGEKGRGNGQFNYPWDVAISGSDEIAISDTRNHRVQLFDPRGTFLNKFGFESSLFYKQFDSPRGLVFSPDGRLFCTDFNNHRLAVIDVVHNQMEFFGREGEYDGAFKRPQGLDIDASGFLLITDSRNNRIQVFTPQLTFLCTIGIEGYPPRGRSSMDRPCDVCVCEGKIYCVDFGNNKIHVF